MLAAGAAGGIEGVSLSGGPGVSGLSLASREIGGMTGELLRDREGVLNSIEEKLRSVGTSCCL